MMNINPFDALFKKRDKDIPFFAWLYRYLILWIVFILYVIFMYTGFVVISIARAPRALIRRVVVAFSKASRK